MVPILPQLLEKLPRRKDRNLQAITLIPLCTTNDNHSTDLRTPVNATQGARDFLVDDDYQFEFDNFPGPRPSGPTNSDAAQQDSRTG
ncbi:hypothetical protein E4U59_005443, partial [Claviceps monticola]